MFQVKHISGRIYTVYAVEGDKFLVYHEQFMWIPMDECKLHDSTIW